MDRTDARLVQAASGGLLVSGLLCVLVNRFLFERSDRQSMKTISLRNSPSWLPRRFGGRGKSGFLFKSMWIVIYASITIYAGALLFFTALGYQVRNIRNTFNACACLTAALQMSALYSHLYREYKPYTFFVSSCLLVVVAAAAVIGALSARPFHGGMNGGLDTAGRVVCSFTAGWLIVAASLSVESTTRVYSKGVDAVDIDEPHYSLTPMVVAVAIAITSTIALNPVLPVPLLLSMFFVRGIFVARAWEIWGAAIVALLGIVTAAFVAGF